MESKAVEIFLKRLDASGDEQVPELLNEVRVDSSPVIIDRLIKRWKKCEDELIRESLFNYFSDLRDQQALGPIMEAILSESDNQFKNALISTLWMSSLDATEYFSELITVALEGDFMTAVEVSTVIENFDSEFSEDEIMEAMYQLDECIMEESDEEMVRMLNNLKEVINNLNVS